MAEHELKAKRPAKQVVRRRRKAGRVAESEIKKLQKSDKSALRREPFRRLVAEVVQSINPELFVAKDAVEALRTAAEAAISQAFGLAGALTTELSKKDTVDLPQFRAAVNILNNDHIFGPAGLVAGALTAGALTEGALTAPIV